MGARKKPRKHFRKHPRGSAFPHRKRKGKVRFRDLLKKHCAGLLRDIGHAWKPVKKNGKKYFKSFRKGRSFAQAESMILFSFSLFFFYVASICLLLWHILYFAVDLARPRS